MTLHFSINYQAQWGNQLAVLYAMDADLQTASPLQLPMDCHGSAEWSAQVTLSDIHKFISYCYVVLDEQGNILRREAQAHVVECQPGNVVLRDLWQDKSQSLFASKVFSQVLFAHRAPVAAKKATGNITLKVSVPRLERHQGVAIMGNIAALGEWDRTKKLPLTQLSTLNSQLSTLNSQHSTDYNPEWVATFHAKLGSVVEYKYVIYDLQSGEIVDMEWGENRKIWDIQRAKHYVLTDSPFRYTQANWKGAGVAVPVFSLRSENGFGIGEYQDLKLLADWAKLTGQKMIQTLPINDTTLRHNNLDSYPYNAVSVFALHPIYLNIEKMGELTPAQLKKYRATQAEFNAKTSLTTNVCMTRRPNTSKRSTRLTKRSSLLLRSTKLSSLLTRDGCSHTLHSCLNATNNLRTTTATSSSMRTNSSVRRWTTHTL